MKKKSKKKSLIEKIKNLTNKQKIIIVSIVVVVTIVIGSFVNNSEDYTYGSNSQEETTNSEDNTSKGGYDYAEAFSNGVAIVGTADGLSSWGYVVGVINKKGQVIIPIKYEAIEKRKNGYIGLYHDKYDFYDKKGNKITNLKYDYVEEFKNGVAVAQIKNKSGKKKYGLIDKSNKVLVDYIYDEISLYEKIAVVKKGDFYGVIDLKGKIVQDIVYTEIGKFKEGLAIICKDDEEDDYGNSICGAIDENGKIVIELKDYFGLRNFNGNVSRGYSQEYGQNVLIDKSGNIVAQDYEEISAPIYGTYELPSDNSIFIGSKKITLKNPYYQSFHAGKLYHTVIESNEDEEINKYSIYDKNGEKVSYIETEYKLDSFDYEITKIHDEDEELGLIDKTGKILLEPGEYKKVSIKKDYIIAKKTDEYGNNIVNLYTYSGKKIGKDYKSVSEFENGLAVVTIEDKYDDKKYEIIDKTGKVIVKEQYDKLYTIDKNYSVSCKKRKCALIENKSGKNITDYEYNDISNKFRNGLLAVERNKKIGYINKKGELIIW